GAFIWSVLCTFIPQVLSVVFEDFIPVTIPSDISWPAIMQGIGLGICISVLFALLPLVGIRNITPLNTLRISLDAPRPAKDKWSWAVYGLIAVFVFVYASQQLDGPLQTAAFTGGVLLAFTALYAMARALMWLVRRFFPFSWSYLWRQGLSNLFRPNNQTVILVIAIGLGTAFIATLMLVQNMLLTRVSLSASEN